MKNIYAHVTFLVCLPFVTYGALSGADFDRLSGPAFMALSRDAAKLTDAEYTKAVKAAEEVGKKDGDLRARMDAAGKLLDRGYSADKVSTITGLPGYKITGLRQIKEATGARSSR